MLFDEKQVETDAVKRNVAKVFEADREKIQQTTGVQSMPMTPDSDECWRDTAWTTSRGITGLELMFTI